MKFRIDGCTCCGFCACIWRNWFYCDSEGRAHAKDVEIPDEQMKIAEKCVDQCIARAISITTTDRSVVE